MENIYKKYEKMKAWKVIEKSLNDLKNNQDLEEKTERKYIVGYLCKQLTNKHLLNEEMD